MDTNREPTKASVAKRFKAAVDEAVKAKLFTPTRLAADIGVSESTLRRFCDGDTEPSYRQAAKAAQLLGKPVEWFLEVEDAVAA